MSDLSLNWYTYDNTTDDEPDPSLDNFALGDNGTAMASLLGEFRQIKPNITILGSPWSPPAWMKSNRALSVGGSDNHLDPQHYTSFARYFVKYLQAYADHNASIDAITIQNEPLHSTWEMPTMRVLADEAVNLIGNYINPLLSDAGLDSTEIWALDHNTGTDDLLSCYIHR